MNGLESWRQKSFSFSQVHIVLRVRETVSAGFPADTHPVLTVSQRGQSNNSYDLELTSGGRQASLERKIYLAWTQTLYASRT